MVLGGDRSEIAFFDVETAVPTLRGKGFAILEFGAILVCPRKLVKLDSYSTLVRPADLSLISTLSVRSNGITKDAVISSPTFAEIADRVYDILQGRIWAGHNILRFDCARIREAFAAINRRPPEPKGTIDSLALLTQRFGRRAGDMKMATLATYFGLGPQTHRSLDDVQMNLEILKHCATVLFLESSLPDIFTENSWISPNATTRSRSNAKSSPDGMMRINASSSTARTENHQVSSCTNQRIKGNHPILSLMTPNTGEELLAESGTTRPDAFDMGPLKDEVERIFHPSDDSDATGEVSGSEYPESDDTTGEESGSDSPESSASAGSEGSSAYAEFLELNEVSIPSLSASLVPLYRGTQGVQIMHKDTALQLCCTQLRVRFAISTKFVDYAGRPRLNFVVDATPNLCRVLDACDSLAQRLSVDSGSNSEWRPVVTRKSGFLNSPTVRLHIPTVRDGSIFRWETDIYKKVISTTPERLVFSTCDVAELECLFIPGSFVDAYFSLDPYDYQQNAGIRLVARKLMLCCV